MASFWINKLRGAPLIPLPAPKNPPKKPRKGKHPLSLPDVYRSKPYLYPLTFFSVMLFDICAATECPTCADNRAAPLFSDWIQAVRICCHHGDTDWESQVSSMATIGIGENWKINSYPVNFLGLTIYVKHNVKTKFPPDIFLYFSVKWKSNNLFYSEHFYSIYLCSFSHLCSQSLLNPYLEYFIIIENYWIF